MLKTVFELISFDVFSVHLLTQLQKKRLQLNHKTNITQNHQKIKLYESLTSMDLKKPHSSRWVGGAEMWRQAETHRDTVWCREAVEQVAPHSHVVDKNWEEYLGSEGS